MEIINDVRNWKAKKWKKVLRVFRSVEVIKGVVEVGGADDSDNEFEECYGYESEDSTTSEERREWLEDTLRGLAKRLSSYREVEISLL
jgi:hypothetical protein